MSNTMENIKTMNSVVRTMLLVGVIGAMGYLGFIGFNHWIKPGLQAKEIQKKMEALQVKFELQQQELNRTRTALKLMKVDSRKAVVKVIEQGKDEETGEVYSVVHFTEVNKDGQPISEPREFRLKGNLMYLDCWLVKFEDRYIEQADELRGESLFVFRSIYGDKDPVGAFSLDQTDSDTKTAYGSLSQQSDFERQIWDDFWTIANDPTQQEKLGIRANHGQANYIYMQPGKMYELDVRASDGGSIQTSITSTDH